MTEITHTETLISTDDESAANVVEQAFNEGWRDREARPGAIFNSRSVMHAAWMSSNAREQLHENLARQDQAAKTSGGEVAGLLARARAQIEIGAQTGADGSLRNRANIYAIARELVDALASHVLDVEDHIPARSSRACQMDNPTPLFDGWVLVPREASAAMIEAAYSRPEEPWGRLYHSIYAAMLSAAPQPPESGWRTDMENAPRDGTHILLADFTPGAMGFGHCGAVNEHGFRDIQPWMDVGHWFDDGFYASTYGCDQAEPFMRLTHWKPLDAPPPPQLPEGKV